MAMTFDIKKLHTLEEAALKSGYCIQHLRRLCHRRKVSHIRRGKWFFFNDEQMDALFAVVQCRTSATRP